MATDLFAGMGGFTFGSVCSGIEAASVAWRPIGWRAVWLAEIEPFPSAVLAHHYPTTPNLGDMTKIAAMVRAGKVQAPDILVGGTPCQAFSVAGQRAGLSDERGALTLAYVELANEIDLVRATANARPCIIVWENVPGVLSSKDNAFGCFLAGLAGEDDPLEPTGGRWADAGYVHGPQRSIAWRVLDAQYFGLAQRRRRVFVVASARAGLDPAAVLFEFDGVRRDSAPSRDAGQETAGTLASRTTGGGFPGTDEACSGYVQPAVSAFHLPTYAIQAGALRTNPASGPDGVGVQEGHAYTLEARAEVQVVAFAQNSRDEVRLMNGDGQIVGALAAEPGMKQTCYVAQGTGDITHTLKAEGGIGGGDKEHVPVAFTTEQTPKFNKDCALTLTKQSPTGGGQIQSVMSAMQVRRFTPRECERLQGFPDDWTQIPWRKKPAEDCPDGPRYKALGNSMAVPCMRFIGLRIERQMAGGE